MAWSLYLKVDGHLTNCKIPEKLKFVYDFMYGKLFNPISNEFEDTNFSLREYMELLNNISDRRVRIAYKESEDINVSFRLDKDILLNEKFFLVIECGTYGSDGYNIHEVTIEIPKIGFKSQLFPKIDRET